LVCFDEYTVLIYHRSIIFNFKRKALSNNIAAEQMEAQICELFTQVAALNGPKISKHAFLGLGGFCAVTVIYIMSRKSANPKYLTKADKGTHIVLWILVSYIFFVNMFNIEYFNREETCLLLRCSRH